MKLRDETKKLFTAQRKEKPNETFIEAQGAQRIDNPKKGKQRH